MGDFEEQSLFMCTYKSRCPICVVLLDQQGEFVHAQLRTRMQMLKALELEQRRGYLFMQENLGLWPMFLYWANLPFTNRHLSAVPELHQIHKGMFKDHLVNHLGVS
jgi:hypothetical protein